MGEGVMGEEWGGICGGGEIGSVVEEEREK